MESTEEGSSEVGRDKGKKPDRTRRGWSTKENETLIAALKELVAQGWKSDNGFRAGYLHKLEDAMKKHIPGTDLRAYPLINSKITIWKRYYYSLTQILSKSGVGFNVGGTFMIDCDDDQWDSIVKSDANASGMRNKRWLFYEDWKEIFGKDRANGEGAEDILEAVNELERNCANNADEFISQDYHVDLEDIVETNNGDNSFSQSQQPNPVPKHKGKKRKSNDGIEIDCDLLREISRNTNSRLETLASRIGYEQDLAKARAEVFEKLGNIPGLSLDDKFNVCEILAKEVEKLEIFKGLPEEARYQYVYRLLNCK